MVNVSVIFATYNREDVIGAVLDKWKVVKEKSHYTFEIICSDDASGDKTVDIIRKYENELPIHIINNEHGGAGKARNKALEMASGELVIFTGDDIFPDYNFIDKHYENYLKHGDDYCTLGRIEWHDEIKLNHLMHHITNIGCEQFGFAGLPPYSIVDFRHFYTSNISVPKKALDNLDYYFDLTFDRYGFEDIELGYRIHKNGVKIYYDPDIVAWHHHIYDSVEKFCNRQFSAGDQLVVFGQLHPEIMTNPMIPPIKEFDIFLHKISDAYGEKESNIGNDILEWINRSKQRIEELERLIDETDNNKDRIECSALYQLIFQLYLYMGIGNRIIESKMMKQSVLAEAAYMFLNKGIFQIFYSGNNDFYEEASYKYNVDSGHIVVEKDFGQITTLRIDPLDSPCVLKELNIYSNGDKIDNIETNGESNNKLDFSKCSDPQVFVTGFDPTKSYQIKIDMYLDVSKMIEDRIQQRIAEELAIGRSYKESVYQDRRIVIQLKEKDLASLAESYNKVIMPMYGDKVRIDTVGKDVLFETPYIYEIEEKPLSAKEFGCLVDILYTKYVDGVPLDNGSVFCECLNANGKDIIKKDFTELNNNTLKGINSKLFNIDEPLLSVIIPSYNHEKYIKIAIDSVLGQSYRNLELIIVDDGSKDNSVEIIKEYKDDRITLVVQENAGAHNAINRGIELSKGKYIAILNSDDYYSYDRFRIMIDSIKKESKVRFACSYIQVIDSDGNKLGVKEGWHNMEPWQIKNANLSYKMTNDFDLNLLISNFTSTTSNFLFERSLYEEIGGMRNLRFVHDWDFALRAAEVTECKMIEEPLMYYRVHSTNTISSNRKWMLFEIAWIWAANINRFFGGKIFREEDDNVSIVELAESLNLQGNDKVFWMILLYISAKKKCGVKKPEEILLDDEQLRSHFIDYVIE